MKLLTTKLTTNSPESSDSVTSLSGLTVSRTRLIDDLLFFPMMFSPDNPKFRADFYVSPNFFEEVPQHSSVEGRVQTNYLRPLASISYSPCQEPWRRLCQAFKNQERVAVVSSHAGINWPNQDGQWRYNVGNGSYPRVCDLLEELEQRNYDLIFLHMCNRGEFLLNPKRVSVIQYETPPIEGHTRFTVREPMRDSL